jgi:uncharacterized secreted protein with C-terminal beta-propeller domain
MKKIILISTILLSFSMADSVLLIKKGWQLVGSSTALDDMSKFTTNNVEQVWHFDAKSQKWLGYSPDTTIQDKIKAQNISELQSLKNWHGFWLKSKKNWSLTFTDTKLTSEPNANGNSDIIELKKGWNLISLPVDTVLSANIFEGMTSWKYSNNSWELSDEAKEEDFPKLGHIKNSDGLWVKANSDKNISVVEEASKLHNFATVEEMEAYIKERATLYSRPYCGIEPFFVGGFKDGAIIFDSVAPTSNAIESDSSSTGVKNASSTNLQESDVDESDILKHNGKHVFYIGKSKDGKRDHINISSFEKLTTKETVELNRITLDDKYISSFYLVKDRLVVLSRKTIDYNNRPKDGVRIEDKEQGIVDIFDVSDIKNVKKVAEYKVDGSFKNSRVIGNNLYLISTFYPKYEITYPKGYLTPSETCKNYVDGKVDYAQIKENSINKYADCYNINVEDGRYFRFNYDAPNIKVTDLLPEINEKDLVIPKRLYASAKQKQATTITTISKFSIADAKYLKSTSFIGNSSIEYASSNALYLVSNGYPFYYDFNNYKSRSMIYKFNFDEELTYKAVGSVFGTALNQFALSEYNDVLRIATTEGFSWGSNGTKNSLYTLKEKDGLLPIEGVLSGLGKEGESIKSVRFMGTKAYLVTFKTTDPLYTIDLSDPKSPKKMGELEVNGYSAYLHPIGEDKLLGIGQDTDSEGRRKGVKIELFDISDFENPSSLDSILLPTGTSSELEYNHKALAYRASDNLFAFPYQQYINGVVSSFSRNNLGIYQVEDSGLKSYEPLTTTSEEWGEHRGLIFDLNGKTYISFFSDDTVLTKILTQKEK